MITSSAQITTSAKKYYSNPLPGEEEQLEQFFAQQGRKSKSFGGGIADQVVAEKPALKKQLSTGDESRSST